MKERKNSSAVIPQIEFYKILKKKKENRKFMTK